MRPRPTFPTLATLLTALVLMLGLFGPVAAQSDPEATPGPAAASVDEAGGASALEKLDGNGKKDGKAAKGQVAVHHGPVDETLATPGSDGHQLGDLRVTSVETTDADGASMGRLDATLTTTAVDVPAEGDEIRTSTLVFSFGPDGSDQIVVSGSAAYPAQGPNISTGGDTVRPIVGGSGAFDGAAGSAVTEHFDDDTWVHLLQLDSKVAKVKKDETKDDKGDAALDKLVDEELRERVKARIADLQAARRERAELRRERFEARRAERAERRADRRVETDGGLDLGTDFDVDPDAPTIQEVGITRTDLGLAEPGSAPGEELGLWHYAIPAGAELTPHTHPGWQIARIAQGELEYTVIAGEGTVIHSDGSSEPIGPGTYTLAVGDSVVENPQLQHYGANRGDEEVIILAATLYPRGAPLSTPIEAPAE